MENSQAVLEHLIGAGTGMVVAWSLLGSLQLQREHREDSSSLQEGYTVSTDLCRTMLSEDMKEITIEVHANNITTKITMIMLVLAMLSPPQAD